MLYGRLRNGIQKLICRGKNRRLKEILMCSLIFLPEMTFQIKGHFCVKNVCSILKRHPYKECSNIIFLDIKYDILFIVRPISMISEQV